MALRDRNRTFSPGHELKNFTDRENELGRFLHFLDLREPAQLPALMFYGVGGTGKSWLLKRIRSALLEIHAIPSAIIDFDRKAGGPSYVSDFANVLSEIWRQFDIECPRFESAYSWMRFKQGAADRPLLRQSGNVSTSWDFLKELVNAGLSSIPGGNLVVWAGDKLGKATVSKLENSSLGEHLLTKIGQEDYLRLSRMTAQEIYPTLTQRLGEDLTERLPNRADKRCRGVVFLDTIEELAGGEQNEARRQEIEEPVRKLYQYLESIFLVMFGRDRLAWEEVDPEWNLDVNLEQYKLGGLSHHDASEFLGKCGIEPGPLKNAILHVSRDETSRESDAYFPFCLGLCADTVQAERSRGTDPDAITFDMAPGAYAKLAQRFLKSLHDEHPEQWIVRLALTPRFDETAARAVFSESHDVHQDEAWESLPDYSFVQLDSDSGWLRLHPVMSDVLRRQLRTNERVFLAAHSVWQAHWRSRAHNEFDRYSALAWYHDYVCDSDPASSSWADKVEWARKSRNMALHLSVIDWWSMSDRDSRNKNSIKHANELNFLGLELCRATLGNRTLNLQRAISCFESALQVYAETDSLTDWAGVLNNLGLAYSYLLTGDLTLNLKQAISYFESALQVYTETGSPSNWAMTQANLGAVYRQIPTGDRGENLNRSIAHFELALRVQNEREFPSEWAKIQSSLGLVYTELPTGHRSENLCRAIAHFESALRFQTEDDSPSNWAKTQNNLGLAYKELPMGDRGENLRRAVTCFELAQKIYTEKEFPLEWAAIQSNLSATYRHIPVGDRDGNLNRAIACSESALRVYTETDSPWDWAEAQVNLGTAYGQLHTGDHNDNLSRAIPCFESALRVHTILNAPSNWAGVQINLGAAYGQLQTGDRIKNLNRAITCFESALKVYTEIDFPRDWAGAQNNLAITYCQLPIGDRRENLNQAIAHFELALRVYGEINVPWHWAQVQFNLGLAYRDLGNFDEAAKRLDLAASEFERLGCLSESQESKSKAEICKIEHLKSKES